MCGAEEQCRTVQLLGHRELAHSFYFAANAWIFVDHLEPRIVQAHYLVGSRAVAVKMFWPLRLLTRELCLSVVHNNLHAWAILALYNVVLISLEESVVRQPLASPVVNKKAVDDLLLVLIRLHLHLNTGGDVRAGVY